MNGIDLASLTPASEILINIKHPATGEPIGVTVSIMSIDDERMKPIKRQIQDRKLKLEQRGKNFKAEEIEENGFDLAFRAMLGWDWGDNTFEGKKPEFSKAFAYVVFAKLSWFHNQIMEAISEEKSFFGK